MEAGRRGCPNKQQSYRGHLEWGRLHELCVGGLVLVGVKHPVGMGMVAGAVSGGRVPKLSG